MVFYALLARLDPAQSRRKVAKNLLFSAKMACFLAIFELQNVVRLSKKVLKLYEQYFLYFFKIENKLYIALK